MCVFEFIMISTLHQLRLLVVEAGISVNVIEVLINRYPEAVPDKAICYIWDIWQMVSLPQVGKDKTVDICNNLWEPGEVYFKSSTETTKLGTVHI